MVELDFSVNHEAVVFKSHQLGIGGSYLNILTEILSNRKQGVVVDGHFDKWNKVISGVPQGGVLCPLLFILFIMTCGLDLKICLLLMQMMIFKLQLSHLLLGDILSPNL